MTRTPELVVSDETEGEPEPARVVSDATPAPRQVRKKILRLTGPQTVHRPNITFRISLDDLRCFVFRIASTSPYYSRVAYAE